MPPPPVTPDRVREADEMSNSMDMLRIDLDESHHVASQVNLETFEGFKKVSPTKVPLKFNINYLIS